MSQISITMHITGDPAADAGPSASLEVHGVEVVTAVDLIVDAAFAALKADAVTSLPQEHPMATAEYVEQLAGLSAQSAMLHMLAHVDESSPVVAVLNMSDE